MENKFLIDAQTAQAILNYLQTKPYAEVYQFINALMQLQPAEASKPPAEFGTAE